MPSPPTKKGKPERTRREDENKSEEEPMFEKEEEKDEVGEGMTPLHRRRRLPKRRENGENEREMVRPMMMRRWSCVMCV